MGTLYFCQEAQEAINSFKSTTDKGLGGFYTTDVDKAGKVTFAKTDKEGEMSSQQKEFYNGMSEVAGHEKSTSIGIVEGTDIQIGSYHESQIDISDVEALGGSDLSKANIGSAQGALAHEVYEQFEKQVNGLDLHPAHDSGLKMENKVNGSTRVEVGAFRINDAKGNAIGEALQSHTRLRGKTFKVNILMINNNVLKVDKKPLK